MHLNVVCLGLNVFMARGLAARSRSVSKPRDSGSGFPITLKFDIGSRVVEKPVRVMPVRAI